MSDQEEMEALRREVAQLREVFAVVAERARLSGQVIDPPDGLLQTLGLRVAQAPLWQMVGGGQWRRVDLGCALTAIVCCEDGVGPYSWRLEAHVGRHLIGGESATAQVAMADVLRAAERIGVAIVSQARVGLKALEEDT